jgi:hypothetical protein
MGASNHQSMTQDRDPAKDGATRQQEYRARQLMLGRKPRLLYLTDPEKVAVDRFVNGLRKKEDRP